MQIICDIYCLALSYIPDVRSCVVPSPIVRYDQFCRLRCFLVGITNRIHASGGSALGANLSAYRKFISPKIVLLQIPYRCVFHYIFSSSMHRPHPYPTRIILKITRTSHAHSSPHARLTLRRTCTTTQPLDIQPHTADAFFTPLAYGPYISVNH